MAHAETCPICWGKGTIPDGNSALDIKPCHGCGGSGWVSVADVSSTWWEPKSFAPNVGFDYLRYMGFNSGTAVG